MKNIKQLKALRGMSDTMPPGIARWQSIETLSRAIFHLFRYQEVRTPILEETDLFVATIGQDSDIVTKEMFSFEDRGKRSVTMRPEGTAPIVRAYLEANLHKLEPFQKFYYIGPMFRAERPQAGRFRQFHQIGIEAIGSFDPNLDAEIIVLLTALLDGAGITGYSVKLNNLGCSEDKNRLSGMLKEVLHDVKKLLCDDCKARIGRNPLRTLDCKKEHCRNTVRPLFGSMKFLCQDCIEHFSEVKHCLDTLSVPYTLDPYVVRGLDYYTRTVFEVTHHALGSQDAIGAGGRYDTLISNLGGPRTGACGFALGVERLLLALGEPGAADGPALDLYFVTLGSAARAEALHLACALRKERVLCDSNYEEKSLKAQMRTADKLKAAFVAIIGENELRRGEAILRNMSTKDQVNIRLERFVREVKTKVAKG